MTVILFVVIINTQGKKSVKF